MIRFYVRIFCLVSLLLAPVLANSAYAEEANTSIRRLVLVVGANDGGQGRATLRYAGTDAARMAKLTVELGGVAPSDIMRIDDSKLSTLKSSLDSLEARLRAAKAPGIRVEVIFYYSGHSDETGLLLGGERYSYKDLRSRVESMPAEVKIAILDSCASGAFTQTKGGTRRPAFLVDESSQVNGYALIASSSATELAQESDRIASSFFTHYFVSGLRGGADGNRDGRVTLSEAYQYAFDETVSRTESTQAGAQHPAYNMHLAGTGDVVMTDLRSTSATLVVEKRIMGRLFIRDSKGDLVVELTKKQPQTITLGLAAGQYSVVLLSDGKLSRANVALNDGKPTVLLASSFTTFKGEVAVTRGDVAVKEESVPTETQYFGISLLPNISTSTARVRRHVSVNLLAGTINQMHGLEIGAGVNSVTDSVYGAQLAGIINFRGGRLKGFQAAGIANIATGATQGVQAAGIVNTSHGTVTGAQLAGIGNLNTGTFTGTQIAGISNHNQGQVRGLQVAGISNYAGDIRGVQVSGIGNYSHGDVTGMQLSLVNISTGKVRGLQLGLVNIAEESDVSFGLVNIVKNGYRSLDVWTSDTAPVALAYKMGSRRFYTMLSLAQSFDNHSQAGFGAGIHTQRAGYYVDVDLLAYNGSDLWSESKEDENDLLAKLRVTVGWQLTDDLSLLGGISFNTTHAFDKVGAEQGLVHKEYEGTDYVLRYGPGVFAGAAWSLGK